MSVIILPDSLRSEFSKLIIFCIENEISILDYTKEDINELPNRVASNQSRISLLMVPDKQVQEWSHRLFALGLKVRIINKKVRLIERRNGSVIELRSD